MISFEGVQKVYDDGTTAVADLDLQIREGELTVLVGPSGCGKTTSMRMVNRLVDPTSGRVTVDGDDVAGVDPVTLRRRIGYVIQQVGLFPHQSVAANVATVPDLLGWDKARAKARANELLELVGLDPDRHGPRYPHQLSGGQRQRVGVARALAADPPVLLMDEPFGAVDPVAREKLQHEFLRLQEQVRKTIVFVTHDIDEAIRLGDRIAVMREGGHLEQYDTPGQVLSAPATDYVNDFVGADRTLRRLSVNSVASAQLLHWPVVGSDQSLSECARVMRETRSDYAVVADGSQVRGWLSLASTEHGGAVPDHVERGAVVESSATMEAALAAILATDAPGVVVVDPADGGFGVLTADGVLGGARRDQT